MGGWVSLLHLAVTFFIMLFLHRWVSAHVQGLGLLLSGSQLVSRWIYFVIFLPGVILHEFSHWLAAKVLFVQTGKISIWPRPKNGVLEMGYVTIEKVDPLRQSLIGVAPLIVGSIAIILISQWRLGLKEIGSMLASGDWQGFRDTLYTAIKRNDFWLWMYLLFAISNSMLPSPSDRKPWVSVIIFFVIIGGLAIALGWTPRIPESWDKAFLAMVRYLIYAFTITIFVDLAFGLVITALEITVSSVTGHYVQYR